MSDGNQLPPAGETACPTYFANRLIQQGGAGGFRLPFQWPHGMTIHKIAELRNCQPIDEVPGLLLEERGAVNLARAAGDVLPRKRSGWLCRKRLIR